MFKTDNHPFTIVFVAEHFARWLDRDVDNDDRDIVIRGIDRLLSEHPDLVNTHSWPEMRRLAERS